MREEVVIDLSAPIVENPNHRYWLVVHGDGDFIRVDRHGEGPYDDDMIVHERMITDPIIDEFEWKGIQVTVFAPVNGCLGPMVSYWPSDGIPMGIGLVIDGGMSWGLFMHSPEKWLLKRRLRDNEPLEELARFAYDRHAKREELKKAAGL